MLFQSAQHINYADESARKVLGLIPRRSEPMGVYLRRNSRNTRSKVWWISYMKDGRQHRESSGSSNKKVATKLLTVRTAQVFEERWNLPRSKSPRFGNWVREFLVSIT